MRASVLSNCMEQARHCQSSGNNTIISLDDCPKLGSWSLYSYYHGTQNSQNNFMVARWVFSSLRDLDPRNLGYYLYPCMLRTIWRVGCLCQTLIAISTLLQLPWPGVFCISVSIWGSPGRTVAKNPPASAGDVRDSCLIPELEDPLEESVAAHSNILLWKTPWTEELGSPWGCKDSDMTEDVCIKSSIWSVAQKSPTVSDPKPNYWLQEIPCAMPCLSWCLGDR